MSNLTIKIAYDQQEQAWALEWKRALADGMRKYGEDVQLVPAKNCYDADITVTWGIRSSRQTIMEKTVKNGGNHLVMERGHIGNREQYTSLGWNGLGYHAKYPKAPDNLRWMQNWSHLQKEWRDHGSYYLLIGQVPGDCALAGIDDIKKWTQHITDVLNKKGVSVVYRPHPVMVQRRDNFCPKGAIKSQKTLHGDLSGARCCVTFNSTTGVESVLDGVSTIAFDNGSMAWPMASHSLDDPLICPVRDQWMWNLAYTQWSMDEIASGEAWCYVKSVIQA